MSIEAFLRACGSASTPAGSRFSVAKSKTGRRLREARRKWGYSQERLATLAGVSVSSVSRFEQGRLCSPELLARLADILEVDLAWLRGEDACSALV